MKVRSKLKIILASDFDDNISSRIIDEFGKLFGIEQIILDSDERNVGYAYSCSEFDDEEATSNTLAYCLYEDMADSHYPVINVEAVR